MNSSRQATTELILTHFLISAMNLLDDKILTALKILLIIEKLVLKYYILSKKFVTVIGRFDCESNLGTN